MTDDGFFVLVPGVRGSFHKIDCAMEALHRHERETASAAADAAVGVTLLAHARAQRKAAHSGTSRSD